MVPDSGPVKLKEKRRMRTRTLVVAVVLVVAGLCGSREGARSQQVGNGGDKAPTKAAPMALDLTMHDFMEAVFQGTYRRLKAAIATAPKDNAGWKAVRTDAVVLAEGCNLVLLRTPKQDGDKWNELTVAVRDSGAELVKAAKARDFPTSRKAYELMIDRCNACHTKFDDGKNQLEK
jgi:hypothetical protein